MDFEGFVLQFHFGRWYCPYTEFYSLSGTSIMESVVLRSGGLTKVWNHIFTRVIKSKV